MYEERYVKSLGKGDLCIHVWKPDGEPVGILQIVHGISEHAKRYDAFADYLNQRGFLVVAEDHMGHGKSVSDGDIWGYFHGGWFTAVEDTYQLLRETKNAFPDLPYVLFGHSMGSFMARTILSKYPDSGIDACVLCGTCWQPDALLSAGIALCKRVCNKRGEQNTSRLLYKAVFGAFNARVEHQRTPFDWLTRVTSAVDEHIKDPMCGILPSAGLVRDMLSGISYIQDRDNMQRMDTSLPVFFVAGGEDPVGDYGSGVIKCAEKFKEVGLENVAVRIYPLCRHELLNELNKAEIMEDIWEWIVACTRIK